MITLADITVGAQFRSYQVPRSLRLDLIIDKLDNSQVVYHTVSAAGSISNVMEDDVNDLLTELNNLKFSITKYENWDI
jgi:hypothetical protein